MGRRKGSKNKSTLKNNTKKSANNNTRKKRRSSVNYDTVVISLIILSILSAVLIYSSAGVLGKVLSPIFGGLMGIIKYIIPPGIFVIGINMMKEDNDYLFSKVAQFIILLFSVTSILHISQFSHIELAKNVTFEEVVSAAYKLGVSNHGGGAIGAIVGVPLTNLLGNVGATIISIGIAIISLIMLLEIKPTELLLDYMDKREERRESFEDEREQIRQRREERRNNKRERLAEINAKIMEDTGSIQQSDNELKHNQIEIMPDEIVINHFNDSDVKEKEMKKDKKTFGLFNRKNKNEDPEELENIFASNDDKKVDENDIFKEEEKEKQDNTKAVLQLEHTMTVEDEEYEYPPVNLLSKGDKKAGKSGAKALTDTATRLQKTLYSFGVSAKVENVSVGPAITRYELKPAEGVRVNKIANLADDIALNLAAETIRIEAPIPGKQAVGIEVPNKEKEMVHLREVIESSEFENNKSKLSVALGKDVAGQNMIADIAKMPHVLIAGSTGSGKSVCINTIITSFIYNAKPSEVKLVMVDPKVVELSVYNGIPHLLIPVVTDPKKAAGALAWAVQEMDKRYNLFAEKGVRDLKGYNAALEKEELEGKLPQIVIIVDELADLMMVAAKDVEDSICRLAQKARAAGMHLVIATQRPSVDVITGLIKANVPSRIAFAVSSQIDSRTILDQVGAEKLLGKGDMLFFPSGASKPTRVQGAFVTDDEVEKIVDFIKANGTATYSEDILESIENSNKSEKDLEDENSDDDSDPFLPEAIETVIEIGTASASLIQRKFKVGYARAARIIDQMEARGIISGYQGSKPREVLMSKERWEELKMSSSSQTNEE
ncbi:MAG: DNA translocase FtsK [Clostridia bacterium]|nr:DNA translocase FtsK [Clostridia bacterium]